MISIIASDQAKKALHPLALAYQQKGIPVNWVLPDELETNYTSLEALAENSCAILLVGAPRRSPRTILQGPVITRKNGTKIPVACIPEKTFESLNRFAKTAARVHQRQANSQPIAVLGQRHKRYLHLARRIETLLEFPKNAMKIFRWTSDLILREEMLKGLQSGMAMAMYFGHGRPIGWVGYYGTRKHHFDFDGEPLGALLSLCCVTASRRRTGLSFAEAIPLQGAAAASFGAVTDTLHTDNMRWAVRIAKSLEEGVSNIGELIVKSLPPTLSAVSSYRIIGDPLAPLYGATNAMNKANKVKVYP